MPCRKVFLVVYGDDHDDDDAVVIVVIVVIIIVVVVVVVDGRNFRSDKVLKSSGRLVPRWRSLGTATVGISRATVVLPGQVSPTASCEASDGDEWTLILPVTNCRVARSLENHCHRLNRPSCGWTRCSCPVLTVRVERPSTVRRPSCSLRLHRRRRRRTYYTPPRKFGFK